MYLSILYIGHAHGCVVKGLAKDRRVASSIPEITDFLTNKYGQATNTLVFLFTKPCKLVPAS
jgi:hypothetical protein